MDIRNTYWIILLGMILSLSLVLPFCCDASGMDVHAHAQEMASQSQGQHCDCGHELSQDIQKNKKLLKSQASQQLPVTIFSVQTFDFNKTPFSSFSIVIPNHPIPDFSPPIHLLNSVFLN